MTNEAYEPPRCIISLHESGEILCRGTIEFAGGCTESVVQLMPNSEDRFHNTDYQTIRTFLLGQPENSAVALVVDGTIELAPDDDDEEW